MSTDRSSSNSTVFPFLRFGAPLTPTHIVLFGETGAGKSTFINYLCNYFLQGEISNPKIAIPSKFYPHPTETFAFSESNLNDSTQSKTNLCTQYTFTDRRTGKRYVFLDTPGIADTRGNEQNNINITRIVDAMIRLGHITTMIFVVNGSINRLSSNLRSIIADLHNNLPDQMFNQVIVLLTNVRKYQSTFDLKMLGLHGQVYPIYMQNGVFVSDPKSWTPSIQKDLQADWDRSMHQIHAMLITIDSFPGQSVEVLKNFRDERNEIRAILHQLRLEMVEMIKIQSELATRGLLSAPPRPRQMEGIVVNCLCCINSTEENLLCMVCNKVCHPHCTSDDTIEILTAGNPSLTIDPSRKTLCAACKYSCSVLNHYRAKRAIRLEEKTAMDFLINLKQRFTSPFPQSKGNDPSAIYFNGEEINDLFERTLKCGIKEIRKRASNMNSICSSFPFDRMIQSFNDHFLLDLNFDLHREVQKNIDEVLQKMLDLADSILENQQLLQKKRPQMLLIDREDILSKENSIDILHQKTADLVEIYKNGPNRDLIIPILSELHRRAAGKSIYPLVNRDEIFGINQCLEKYRDKTVQELSFIYRKLQVQINEILFTNILDIVKVPTDLLRENFTVLALLEQKEGEGGCDRNPSPAIHFSFQAPFFPPTTKFAELCSGEISLTVKSTWLGFPPVNPLPYPVVTLNANPHSRTLPLPYPIQPSFPTGEAETDPNRSFFGLSLNKASNCVNGCRSEEPSDSDSNRPFNSDCPPQFDRSGAIGFQETNHHHHPNGNEEELYSITNTRLVWMYEEAKKAKNHDRQMTLHNELHRRCFGHYPRLLEEQKSFFQERIGRNRSKSLDRLLKDQESITHKIRSFINQNDVTLINEIPRDLIIEAAALFYLIQSWVEHGDTEERSV